MQYCTKRQSNDQRQLATLGHVLLEHDLVCTRMILSRRILVNPALEAEVGETVWEVLQNRP